MRYCFDKRTLVSFFEQDFFAVLCRVLYFFAAKKKLTHQQNNEWHMDVENIETYKRAEDCLTIFKIGEYKDDPW